MLANSPWPSASGSLNLMVMNILYDCYRGKQFNS